MIRITKKASEANKGQAMIGLWKSTHKRLSSLSAATGRSMAEIVDIAVAQTRVAKNGKK